jgi:hypothetical protein
MNSVAVKIRGPKAPIFSDVNAETIDEKIRQGREMFFADKPTS